VSVVVWVKCRSRAKRGKGYKEVATQEDFDKF